MSRLTFRGDMLIELDNYKWNVEGAILYEVNT